MAPLAPLVAMRRSTSESIRELPASEQLMEQNPPSQLGSLATAPPLMRLSSRPLQESASMPRSNRMAEMRALSGSLPEKVQEKEPSTTLSALRLPPGRLAADPLPVGKGEPLAALPMKLPARLHELPLQPLGGASKSLLPSKLQEPLGHANSKQLSTENALNMTMRPGKLLPSASMPAPKASGDLCNPPLGRPSLRSLSAVGDNSQVAPASPRPKKLTDEIGHCRERLSEEGGAASLPLRPACSLPSILPAPPMGPARTNNPRTNKYSLRNDSSSSKAPEAVAAA